MVELYHFLTFSTNRFNAYIDYNVYNNNYAKAAFLNCTISDYEPFDLEIPPVIIRQKTLYYQVLYIGSGFASNSRIKSVKIPKTIKYIEQQAFSNCPFLVKINLPEGIIAISKYAFSKTSIEEVYLPDSLRLLETGAFKNCDKIRVFSFGDGLARMHDRLFIASPVLESIYIGKNFGDSKWILNRETLVNIALHPDNKNYVIEDDIMYSRDHLILYLCFNKNKTIRMHENTMKLANNAFMPNLPVETIYLPKYFSVIEGSFGDCHSLQNLYCDPENTKFYDTDGVLYLKDKPAIACFPCARTDNFIIPNNITQLDNYVFSDCKLKITTESLQYITFIGVGAFRNCPNIVGSLEFNKACQICESAFENCTGLNDVITFPARMEKIPDSLFRNCFNIKTIVFPAKLKIIGKNAFRGCISLTGKLLFPKQLTAIEEYAFSGCINLDQIILPSSLKTFSASAFDNIPKPQVYFCGNESSIQNCIQTHDIVNYKILVDWRHFKDDSLCGVPVNKFVFDCSFDDLPRYEKKESGSRKVWKRPPTDLQIVNNNSSWQVVKLLGLAIFISIFIGIATIIITNKNLINIDINYRKSARKKYE